MAVLPGTRIRDNGVFGVTTDNPLTAGAVAFNSANLALLSVVSGNHALVTLDPLRQFGAPEIVMVTVHTAAATVATIQRGMFGTVARSHPQGTLWVHAAADNDFIEIVTSSTRPSDQYEGQAIYEADTDFYMGFNGSTWGKLGSAVDTSPYSNHFLANPPACRVTHNTTQSIPSGFWTALTFNTEFFDTGGLHSTSSNPTRITIVQPGLYLFTMTIGYSSNSTGRRLFGLRKNGTGTSGATEGLLQTDPSAGGSNGEAYGTITALVKMAAGDYMEAITFQTSGVALNAVVTDGVPLFSTVWVGLG